MICVGVSLTIFSLSFLRLYRKPQISHSAMARLLEANLLLMSEYRKSEEQTEQTPSLDPHPQPDQTAHHKPA
jgi:hypothetical protein